MTGDEEESDLGQWQPGTAKPNMDGTYLREFDEGEATSEFHQGVWLRDGFFPSDLQDVRWRGRAAPQQEPSRDAKTWCSYVAGMIGCYLKKPDESAEVRAIAGIIERRLWALPAPQPAPAPLSDDAERDAAFEAVRKKLCALPRFSFLSDGYGVRRVPDKSGSWIAFDAAHAMFDPVAVDAALATQGGE